MRTECAWCERYAVRFWGPHAYCRDCLGEAREAHTDAHSCKTCNDEQLGHAPWQRDTQTCSNCQARAARSKR